MVLFILFLVGDFHKMFAGLLTKRIRKQSKKTVIAIFTNLKQFSLGSIECRMSLEHTEYI